MTEIQTDRERYGETERQRTSEGETKRERGEKEREK